MSLSIDIDVLRAHGYHPRHGDVLFCRVLTDRPGEGIRAGIISGPPGVGKTALGRAIAAALGAELIYFLCHHWVAEEDLFIKLDPARVAAVAGGVEGVGIDDAYRPGVLLRATFLSRERPVVLLLDEWDKAPERVDALLLEFLQTGRVIGPFGEVWQAVMERLYVIVTDNGVRPLSEPLLRRCFRYHMGFLPAHVEADILRKATGAPTGAVRAVVTFMNVIRQHGVSSPSLQEGQRLLECMGLASSPEDVRALILGWLVKQPQDEDALTKFCGDPASVLWGEWKR